ncbi:MAG TPA: type II toxin-antitoxin system Phd/YefM family antitoxin [Desulfitobacterium dehalogenans]|uniref:Antitoxin n=1 Tax=Desulfitobacterium dehalogenans TaxID=36854 RepID=A0A7C6Z769_9FIRM|nr:type II toxin-antitoxin system Phd/YefM family antitoxin [Desulfitobacterium dehalogenans]
MCIEMEFWLIQHEKEEEKKERIEESKKGGIPMSLAAKDDFNDFVMFGPKQLVSSTKLVRNLANYLDKAQKAPIFIERDQEVEAVLISIDDYRGLLAKEEEYENMYLSSLSLRRDLKQKLNKESLLTTEVLLKSLGLNEG